MKQRQQSKILFDEGKKSMLPILSCLNIDEKMTLLPIIMMKMLITLIEDGLLLG